MENLEEEANELTRLIRGKAVKVIRRHRVSEVMLEFHDGSRLFANTTRDGLELSVTGGDEG